MTKYTFKDGTELEVAPLELSSKRMRQLRNRDELSIMYDLMEEHLSEDELAVTDEQPFPEVTEFFRAWFDEAVSGK